MIAPTDTESMVELKLATTGVVWHAILEAQGTDHLRVRLRPDDLGVLPALAAGTSLECTMRSEEGSYYVIGSVLKQQAATIWLSLPKIWRKEERRDSVRATGGFVVKYIIDTTSGVAACMDVSAGGMRLRTNRAFPRMSHVYLLFTLPGEALPVHVQGLVLHSIPVEAPAQGVDLGIKFSNLAIGDATRIARYCRS